MTDTLEKQVAEWSSDANDAVEIALIDRSGNELATFHPRFTYPIFGEEETIFGYKDLHIKVSFVADVLKPLAEISYAEKFKTVGDVKAADVKSILQDFLPSEAFVTRTKYDEQLQELNSTFAPPGRLVHSFSRGGKDYEIWCAELANDEPKNLLGRIQIMTSFYIEGGVPLDLEEEGWSRERWRVFFVYEKRRGASPTYSICGYATSYRFVTYQRDSYRPKPGTTFDEFPPPQIHPFELPNRSRISQFVIFPPSQGRGLGRHLYNTMFDEFLADPACIELTVEDPNEEFDDLRDYCDFARLTSNGTFSQLHLDSSIDPKLTAKRPGVRVPTAHLIDKPLFEQLRVRNKIQPRQWKRLVDMYLLSQIPKYSRQGGVARLTQRAKSSDPGDKAYYYLRLLVKQRIYVQNVSIMAQFDLPERIEKLEETLEGQVADYERLLSRIEEENAKKDTESMEGVTQEHNGEPPSQRNRKRVIEDEDSAEESEPKRARTAEVGAET